MKDTNLTGELRTEDFGSAGSRRVLASKRIPAVIYGKQNKPVHITLDANDFQNKMRYFSESTLLTIKVGRKNHSVLMKEYQENILKGSVLHVDFFEVTKGEVLRTRVPVHLTGSPEGGKFGGILEQVSFEIEVECLPSDLPPSITVDVSALGLNESIRVSEIEIAPEVKVLTHHDVTIATVKGVKEEVAVEEEEGEGEVEVISEAGSDSEEESNE